MNSQYSPYNMVRTFAKNRPLIQAYLQNKSVEGFNPNSDDTIMGMAISIFLITFIIVVGIWIWALVITIKYWKVIPPWAQVIAIIGLVSGVGGPVATIIAVYVGKNNK